MAVVGVKYSLPYKDATRERQGFHNLRSQMICQISAVGWRSYFIFHFIIIILLIGGSTRQLTAELEKSPHCCVNFTSVYPESLQLVRGLGGLEEG